MAKKKTTTSKADTAAETAAAAEGKDEQTDAQTGSTHAEQSPAPEDAARAPEDTDQPEADTPQETSAADAPGPDEPANRPDATTSEPTGSKPDTPREDDKTSHRRATPADLPVAVPDAPAGGRTGGVFLLLLGGVLAGAIGYAAAYMGFFQHDGGRDAIHAEMIAGLAEQSERIDAVSAALESAPDSDVTAAVDSAISEIRTSVDQVSGRIDDLGRQLADLDTRLTDLEKRPISEGASDAAVAAYERELKALQDAMATQRAEIETMARDARNMEDSAEETARATMRRAALTRVQTALDTGERFGPAVGDLQAAGVDVPAALADVAEEGISSQADLQESFPDAARAALAVSRRDAARQGQESGLSAFLKNQLGTRSLEPREGDDPDAVLSRAEAAVREGRLTDALAEIETLPEPGRMELSYWTEEARKRLDALAASEALSQELN